MLNQFVIVGRIIEINDNYVKVSIPRQEKNDKGEFICDIIQVVLSGGLKDRTNEYCKVDDLIGVKGRFETDEIGVLKLSAEKITFLSSKKIDE